MAPCMKTSISNVCTKIYHNCRIIYNLQLQTCITYYKINNKTRSGYYTLEQVMHMKIYIKMWSLTSLFSWLSFSKFTFRFVWCWVEVTLKISCRTRKWENCSSGNIATNTNTRIFNYIAWKIKVFNINQILAFTVPALHQSRSLHVCLCTVNIHAIKKY